jgi:hypothetical protein
VGDVRNVYNISANLKGKDYSEDLGVDGRIICIRMVASGSE